MYVELNDGVSHEDGREQRVELLKIAWHAGLEGANKFDFSDTIGGRDCGEGGEQPYPLRHLNQRRGPQTDRNLETREAGECGEYNGCFGVLRQSLKTSDSWMCAGTGMLTGTSNSKDSIAWSAGAFLMLSNSVLQWIDNDLRAEESTGQELLAQAVGMSTP